MRIVFLILISVLASVSAFAQNPTSVYWIKSRVTDSTTVTYPTGWGVIYYNGQSNKWRICNGSGVCKDVGSGSGSGSVAWGDITGLISNQTDLQDSLLYKRNLKTKLRTFTTDHTIQAADAERIVFMNSASSNNFTVAPNSSVAIPLYTTIWLSQIGVGVTTVVEGGGVTVTSSSGSLIAPGQNALMMLYKTGTDTWMLFNGTAILPIDLTADVTGVLPYANGGLGLSSLGTAGQSLRVNVGETGYEFYTPSVGSGTVTSVSVTPANGVSGSVATATTTPAITLALGAITPTSVNSVVISGSSTPTLAVTGTTAVSGTNTGDQTSVTGNAGTATALAIGRTIGTLTGDATSAGSSFDGTTNNTNAVTLATVNSNVGSFGSATLAPIVTVNGKGLITAISTATITPAIGSVTGLGTNVSTFLGTPSSANLASALTDEAGSSGGFTRADYVDAKVADAINDGTTTIAPSQNAVFDALALKADKFRLANRQTASYTGVLTDVDKRIEMNVATSNTFTIPLNASVAYPDGTEIAIIQFGVGQTTLVVSGLTIINYSGSLVTPGQGSMIIIRKITGDQWYVFNGGPDLTVSNGLTRTANNITLGGTLTANTSLLGAFSLGVGVAPSAKLHIQGLSTTTGEVLRVTDATPTTRFKILENGEQTSTVSSSGAGVTSFSNTATLTSTANSQTHTGFDNVITPVTGGFTGQTYNHFRIRNTSVASGDYYNIGTSQTWNGTQIYNFRFGTSTSVVRNDAGAMSLRGGTTATTDMLLFEVTAGSSTNNNNAFRFTSGTHDISAGAVTRTWNEIVADMAITAGNGNTINSNVLQIIPSYSVGTSILNINGIDYNPTISVSGTLTNYAMRLRSGLSALGQANVPTAFADLAASTTASASLRVRSGTAPTSPNDGEIWQDGTNFSVRSGSTTYILAKTITATATLDFPNTAAGTCEVLTITLTGAALGDDVSLGIPNASVPDPEYIYPTAWVSATNTVTVKGCNIQGLAALDPASGTFRVTIKKY